jgi:transcriptional regulator with XRE-family HTH domain
VHRGIKPQGLGDILKRRRLEFGLSERDMALAISRSSAFVRAYEAGKASLTIEELEAAALVLDSTLGELVAEYERLKSPSKSLSPGIRDA